MAGHGPPPTPTPILKLRGSRIEAHRRHEPQPREGAPRMPSDMSPEAKAAWKHLVPELMHMGVLTRIDGNALKRYCTIWARWWQAEQFIAEHGSVYPIKNDAGRTTGFAAFPQENTVNKTAEQLFRLEQQFGMMPSARARISVNRHAAQETNDKRRFFQA